MSTSIQKQLIKLVEKFLKKLKLHKTEVVADYDDKIKFSKKLPVPIKVYQYFENIGLSGSFTTTVFETKDSIWFMRYEKLKISKEPLLAFLTGDLEDAMNAFHEVKYSL